MIYIFLFILLFILAFAKGGYQLYKLGLLAILATTCLRSQSIGIDTANGYYSYFEWIANGSDLTTWLEPGWVIINKIAIQIGLGYQGVLVIAGLLTILPVSYVIKRTCINWRYSLAVYYGMCYVLISYNLMRQAIAISFALLAMFFYINKEFRYAILGFLIGLSFHESILFTLPIILFLKLDISYYKVVLIVMLSFLLGMFLSDGILIIFAGKYGKSLVRGTLGFRGSLLKAALFSFLFDMFFLFLIGLNYDILRKNPYFLISLLGVLLMNITMRMTLGTRIVLYFSQAQMICIPNYIKRIKLHNNRTVMTLTHITYLLINFIRILSSQWETLTPYTFFWST